MKQLKATHPTTGMVIIQRFIKGTRFLKTLPSHFTKIHYQKLKQQFENRPVSITLGKMGWIKIEKTGRDPQLENAAEIAIKKEGKKPEDVDEDYILNQEAKILKQQGFIVEVEDI